MPSNILSSLINEIALKIGLKSSPADETELNDLTYEDALLEVELRSFFRAEYGKQEPPSSILPKVLHSIRLLRQEQERKAIEGRKPLLQRAFGRAFSSMGEALVNSYRFSARADAGRIVSGSLLTALVLLAVWPSMTRFLNDNGQLGPYTGVLSGDAYSSQVEPATGGEIAQGPTGSPSPESNGLTSQAAPNSSDGATSSTSGYISPGRIYEDPRLMLAQRTGEDPNELKKHTARPNTAPDNPVQTDQTQQDHNRPMSGLY